jgi:hypothetical protein
MQMPPGSSHRRIEPLQMPRLHDAAKSTRQIQNPVSIGQTRSQRLLHQQIDPGSQQHIRSRSMMNRRHADRSSIQPAHSAQTSLNALEGGNAEISSCLRRDSRILIDDSHKLNLMTGILKLTIDAQMIAPKGARSNNSNSQWTRTRHLFAGRRFDSLAATRIQLEQVRHLVIRFCSRSNAKAGGACAFAADIGLSSDKLEQIERNIFRAARRCVGFHEVVPHFSLARS